VHKVANQLEVHVVELLFDLARKHCCLLLDDSLDQLLLLCGQARWLHLDEYLSVVTLLLKLFNIKHVNVYESARRFRVWLGI